jgi:hypothetical protein
MSKLNKLLNHPGLFFKDAFKKMLLLLKGQNSYKSLLINNSTTINSISIAIYAGDSNSAENYLQLWIPLFIKSHVEFIILTRHRTTYYNALTTYPYLPLIFAEKTEDLNLVMKKLPLLKSCFYLSNNGNNIDMLNYNQLSHIFLGHGDSDKSASAHKFFRVYDEIWTAGDAHRDRFVNEGFPYDSLKFVKTGRPALKKILNFSTIVWNKRFKGSFKMLYLPTWEGLLDGQDYSSLSICEEIVHCLFKNFCTKKIFSLTVKLHPGTGQRISSFKKTEKKLKKITKKNPEKCKIARRQMAIEPLLKETNIFICDISATISDCLAANGPIFVYMPKERTIELAKSRMPYEYYAYIFTSADELIEKIEMVLNKHDYLQERRKEAMEYILGAKQIKEDVFYRRLKETDRNVT